MLCNPANDSAKKGTGLAGVFLCISCLATLVLAGCEFIGTEFKPWKLSGEASYATTHDMTDCTMKMAAFYFAGGDGRFTSARTMVSNVVTVDNSAPPFTLDIDATKITPKDGDRIILYMWIESNTEPFRVNMFDDDEIRSIVYPVSNDLVFSSDSFAAFTFYVGHADKEECGWYVKTSSGDRHIEIARLDGARLTNDFDFR